MAASKERDQNIQKVIKAAQSLFISEGVAATSINRIAREAGLTPHVRIPLLRHEGQPCARRVA